METTPHPIVDKERRYGFIGLIVPNRQKNGRRIQEILEAHAPIIHGRMGLPHLANDRLSIITLIVHASTDELGSLTGQLGRVEGVSVKSGLAKVNDILEESR
jgi:aspartate ammonia-lyase